MYRNRGLIFPLVLIGIGVIILLSNTGVLSSEALQRLGDLWPLLLVILGLQLILNHTLPRQQATIIGLAAAVLIVIAGVAYAALAPTTTFGARQADSQAQLGGLTGATLDLNYSGATLDVQSGSLGDLLYTAHVDYPASDNPPTISIDHETGRLEIRESSSFSNFSPFRWFGPQRRHVLVTLTDRIPWGIQIDGGAASERLDLRQVQLSKLQVSGGANRVDVQVAAPKGTVLINVSGGASSVTLRAPAQSEWRVAISGGVSAVTINGSSSGNLGGDFQQQSPGYTSAANRFDIEISGGASHIDFRTG